MRQIYSVCAADTFTLALKLDGTLAFFTVDLPADKNFKSIISTTIVGDRTMLLLEAVDTEHLTSGQKLNNKLIILEKVSSQGGKFYLRHATGGQYLQISSTNLEGSGDVSFVEGLDDEATEFHLTEIPNDKYQSASLSRLAEDFALTGKWLKLLLETANDLFWPLVRLLIHQLSVVEVRAAWSGVARSKQHDPLYEDVQNRSMKELPVFQSYTSNMLQAQAAEYGWSIGEKSYGMPRVMEVGRGILTIGRYCSMADPLIILGNHNLSSASTYPFMDLWSQWPGTSPGLNDHMSLDVTIGNDVWIGVQAIILPGAVIGDGAVIGAGAVVHGTVPPYAICAGSPAKIRRKRFDEKTIERLLALKWWYWPDAVVDRYIPLLLSKNISNFLDHAEAEFWQPQAVAIAAPAQKYWRQWLRQRGQK